MTRLIWKGLISYISQQEMCEDIMNFLSELWGFLKDRKKFWLLPLIVVLVILGALVVLGGGSAIAPFIYTIF